MADVMQFGDFLFSHNPQTITVSRPGGVVSHFCPGRGDVAQLVGGRARVVRCEGCFLGADYRESMAALQRFTDRAGEGQRGLLLVPGLPPFFACLREMSYSPVGDGRMIAYTMVFVEAGEVSG